MDVIYLKEKSKWPKWATKRYRRLDFYDRFLQGEAYRDITKPFFHEKDVSGEYIPLRERRPSVIYNVAKIVVTRSSRILFGGTHWPRIDCEDKEVTDFFQRIVDTTSIKETFLDAATKGSLGSVLVLFAYTEGVLIFENWKGKYCSPVFNRDETLKSVRIRYPSTGEALRAAGFTIDEDSIDDDYLVIKEYTDQEEIVYTPIKVDEYDKDSKLTRLDAFSFEHGLGFVPGVWIKNFPASDLDGECTFKESLPIIIEIDYLLSQLGRGIKYNMDPQLIIKEPAGGMSEDASPGGGNNPTQAVRSTNNVIYTNEKGDAKLLETNGNGHKVAITLFENLRRIALEVCSASRKDPDKSYGNMSGRAMEILDEDLISLAGVFRLTYGKGLSEILLKVLAAGAKLELPDTPKIDNLDLSIQLLWGAWFEPTPNDLQTTETALTLALKGRRMYDSEARQQSANLWGHGHADPKKIAAEWETPPRAALVQDEIDIKKSAARGPEGAPAKASGASEGGNGGQG